MVRHCFKVITLVYLIATSATKAPAIDTAEICIDRPDGANPIDMNGSWTSFYVVCLSGKALYTAQCGRNEVFSAYSRQCMLWYDHLLELDHIRNVRQSSDTYSELETNGIAISFTMASVSTNGRSETNIDEKSFTIVMQTTEDSIDAPHHGDTYYYSESGSTETEIPEMTSIYVTSYPSATNLYSSPDDYSNQHQLTSHYSYYSSPYLDFKTTALEIFSEPRLASTNIYSTSMQENTQPPHSNVTVDYSNSDQLSLSSLEISISYGFKTSTFLSSEYVWQNVSKHLQTQKTLSSESLSSHSSILEASLANSESRIITTSLITTSAYVHSSIKPLKATDANSVTFSVMLVNTHSQLSILPYFSNSFEIFRKTTLDVEDITDSHPLNIRSISMIYSKTSDSLINYSSGVLVKASFTSADVFPDEALISKTFNLHLLSSGSSTTETFLSSDRKKISQSSTNVNPPSIMSINASHLHSPRYIIQTESMFIRPSRNHSNERSTGVEIITNTHLEMPSTVSNTPTAGEKGTDSEAYSIIYNSVSQLDTIISNHETRFDMYSRSLSLNNLDPKVSSAIETSIDGYVTLNPSFNEPTINDITKHAYDSQRITSTSLYIPIPDPPRSFSDYSREISYIKSMYDFISNEDTEETSDVYSTIGQYLVSVTGSQNSFDVKFSRYMYTSIKIPSVSLYEDVTDTYIKELAKSGSTANNFTHQTTSILTRTISEGISLALLPSGSATKSTEYNFSTKYKNQSLSIESSTIHSTADVYSTIGLSSSLVGIHSYISDSNVASNQHASMGAPDDVVVSQPVISTLVKYLFKNLSSTTFNNYIHESTILPSRHITGRESSNLEKTSLFNSTVDSLILQTFGNQSATLQRTVLIEPATPIPGSESYQTMSNVHKPHTISISGPQGGTTLLSSSRFTSEKPYQFPLVTVIVGVLASACGIGGIGLFIFLARRFLRISGKCEIYKYTETNDPLTASVNQVTTWTHM